MTNTAMNAAVPRDHEKHRTNVDLSYLYAAAREGLIELEDAADAILAAEGALGREGGIYTEAQLARKSRREMRLPTIRDEGIPRDVIDYLVERQIDDLIEVSGLTAMQEIVFRLHAGGVSVVTMAASLGLQREALVTHLRAARAKVRTATREGKYAGWYEVYLSEVRRHTPR